MRGKVLAWDGVKDSGLITGEDGQRYVFDGSDLVGSPSGSPRQGQVVDFQADGNAADEVVIVAQGLPSIDRTLGERNKWIAALLAFFLGMFGVHKFYMGKTGAGIVMLLCGTIGWLLILPPLIIGLVAFVEMIIYLVKTEDDFHRDYVEGSRSWF